MEKNFKKTIQICLLLILPITLSAQKDVTQFLDIPIDGYKAEMIEKLKSKGFTSNKYVKDVLEGEFNGNDVYISIQTNNNKVWRIIVSDKNTTNVTNIRIRFNNLIQQFVNNERYSKVLESTITNYTIPEDEDISYEIGVNNKRYQASFSQKSKDYDYLTEEVKRLSINDSLKNKNAEKLSSLIVESALATLNKNVWFMILQDGYDEYKIALYYENIYNKANGSKL